MMPTFNGVKPNQQNCILKKISWKSWLTTHSELYGKSDHYVPFKTKEFHFLDMFFPAKQLIITWVRGLKKEARHLHYMIDTVAGY